MGLSVSEAGLHTECWDYDQATPLQTRRYVADTALVMAWQVVMAGIGTWHRTPARICT